MSLRYQLRPRADADIDELADYYASEAGEDLGIRFLDAIAEAIGFITERPEAGAPRAFLNLRLTGLRSWPVPGFESVRVYYVTPGVVEIVRVLHNRRDLPTLLSGEV